MLTIDMLHNTHLMHSQTEVLEELVQDFDIAQVGFQDMVAEELET